MNLAELSSSFSTLMNDYKALKENPSKEKYENFGWKAIDFVGNILDVKSYKSEELSSIKKMLLDLKGLVPEIKALKEFIDTYIKSIPQNTPTSNKALTLENKAA